MKLFLIACLVASAIAELPRFRPARFRSQRLELVPTTTEMSTETTTDVTGPYPPSGWRPAGQAFELPSQTEPTETYGPPDGPYPPSGWKPAGQPFNLPSKRPASSYGAPDSTYGSPTEAPSTDAPQAERLDGPVEVLKSIGTYYVLLPNGQLQRVQFVTENDVQNMKYTARLELRERAPLYVLSN